MKIKLLVVSLILACLLFLSYNSFTATPYVTPENYQIKNIETTTSLK